MLLQQQCVMLLSRCSLTALQLANGLSTLKALTRGRPEVVGNGQHATATTRREARPTVPLDVAPSLSTHAARWGRNLRDARSRDRVEFGVSTPCSAVLTGEAIVFVPVLLDL